MRGQLRHAVRLGMSLRTRLTLWYGALLAITLLTFSGLVPPLLATAARISADLPASSRNGRR